MKTTKKDLKKSIQQNFINEVAKREFLKKLNYATDFMNSDEVDFYYNSENNKTTKEDQTEKFLNYLDSYEYFCKSFLDIRYVKDCVL